jgi:dephospho-CoA kinase
VLRAGLTGGIASGKTRVLQRLASTAGIATLDLDAVAHRVLDVSGSAYVGVVQAFGSGILGPGGAIDRKALGRVVFADAAARERLNALTHPHIRDEERREAAEAARRGARVFVTDAALLVEVGMHLRYDRLVVAHCPPDVQLQRLMFRDGLDEAAARARLAAQMDPEVKRRFAHFVVDTSAAVEDTDRGADRVAEQLRAIARGRGGRALLLPEMARAALSWVTPGPGVLSPARLLSEGLSSDGLEMRRLQGLAAPGAAGPWYAASAAGLRPETLAVPAVLWALVRAGADAPFTAAVVHSVARLATADPPSIAGACAYAIALQEAAVERRVVASDADLRVWAAIGERWGGAPPRPAFRATVEAAARAFGDTTRVRENARASGGDPELAGALVGIATGTGTGTAEAPAEIEAAVETLGRVGAS